MFNKVRFLAVPVALCFKAIPIGFEASIGRLRPQTHELTFRPTPPDLRSATFGPWAQLSSFKTVPNVSSDLKIGGVEGSVALRIWISCVRAQFAAILVEKSHIFGIKKYRHTCRPISEHFYRFLGAHCCFGRICARAALSSLHFYILRAGPKSAIP